MELATTISIGVISGLLTSILFFLLLRGLRPNIIISPYIAETIHKDQKYYDFKIVNKASRPAINIRAHIVIARPTSVEDGFIFTTKNINLVCDNTFELASYSKKDSNAPYAFRFSTTDDLDQIWINDAEHIRFKIIATDSESGFSRSFLKAFHTKRNSIVIGMHKSKDSLEVS